MRSPSNSIEPLVISPRSAWSRLEIALSVVDLPAPLAPRRATTPPARQRLALGLKGDAHGFREDDPVDDAAVVVDRADPALLDVATARAVDVLQDLLDHGEVAAARVEGGRDVPRGRVAGRPDVLLGAAPPDAPEVIDREAVFLRLLDGRRARLPPVPLEHVVRPVVAGDVDPGRALLDARRPAREVSGLEAPLPREP